MSLRIPQEKFEAFYEQLGSSVHVVYSSRSSEDVTEQYTDIETRLATLTTKHERLLALLDQADKMEDIISLENALADCEYEIDSLTGSSGITMIWLDFDLLCGSGRGADADRNA